MMRPSMRQERSTGSIVEPPNDDERSRFGFNRRPSLPSRSPRSTSRAANAGSSTVADAVSKATNGQLDFVSLMSSVFEDTDALKALLRVKLTAGKYDYKGRINELTDLNEDLKSALSQQMVCIKEIKDAAALIQENMNTRLSVQSEEVLSNRAEQQQLSAENAVLRQQVNGYDDLQREMLTARREREQAIAECTRRVETTQDLCKREVAEAADACQRQMEGVAHMRDRILELEAQVASLTQERDQEREVRAELVRDNAQFTGEATALRAAKQDLQAQLAEKEHVLSHRDVKHEELQTKVVELESLSKQSEHDMKAMRAQVALQESKLEATTEELRTVRTDLVRAESLLEQRDRALSQEAMDFDKLQARFVEIDNLCTQRAREIEALREHLSEKDRQVNNGNDMLAKAQAELDALRPQFKDQKQQLQAVLDEHSENQQLLERTSSNLEKLEAKFKDKDTALQQRVEQLQGLEFQLREKGELLRQKDDDLREALRSTISGNEQLQAERHRAQQLDFQLHTLRETEAELREKAQASAQSFDRLRNEMAAQRQEKQGLEAERDQFADIAAKAQAALCSQREETQNLQAKLRSTQADAEYARTQLLDRNKRIDELLQAKESLQLEFSSYKEHHGVSNQDQMGAITDLKLTVDKLSKQVDAKQSEIFAQQGNVGMQKEYSHLLEARLAAAERERRELHNVVQELKGNIRVFCRVRPATQGSEQALEVCEADKLNLHYGAEVYPFSYDKVFGTASSQTEVFDEVSGLVQSALDGYKVCIFAYGQTGSGKTFTMQGTNDSASWGLIPRSLSKIFESSNAMCGQGWAWSLRASFFEVYNESFRDLLQTGTCCYGTAAPVHVIKHDDAWGAIVTNMTSVEVDSMEQINSLTARAAKQRAVGATDINSVSSRSHGVFALYLKGTNQKLNCELHGALHLVDLAGSERLDKSGSTGDRLKETQNINKSLSSLADVFLAKTERRSHVPFRNSKLTHLMEPCLSGHGKTLMLVNVCPEESNGHETLCSLRFASQVNQCSTGGKARRSVKPLVEVAPKTHQVVRQPSARRLSYT